MAQATQAWAKQRRKQLQTQADFAKRTLKGRTGAERLAQASVTATTELVVDEINDFLTGDT